MCQENTPDPCLTIVDGQPAIDTITAEYTTLVEDLERLYRSGFQEFVHVAEAITGNRESGLESVQEGFARALRYLPSFRGESSLSTWVWSCVTNAAKSARSRTDVFLSDDVVDSYVETSTRPTSNVRELITSLPERQRIVLFLRYYADLDYRTIADVLCVEVGTIGTMLNRAHATLRRRLQEDTP